MSEKLGDLDENPEIEPYQEADTEEIPIVERPQAGYANLSPEPIPDGEATPIEPYNHPQSEDESQ